LAHNSIFCKHIARSVKTYVRVCLVCQQAKLSIQPPAGLLQPLPILTHIWQNIVMDFITNLPLSHGYSVIFVIVDRLSKFAYFIPLLTNFSASKVVDIFLQIVESIHDLS